MFEWKVEDMVLLNQENYAGEKIYYCERTTSREDKIAFVDSMQDGKLSYILSLIKKFNIDRASLSKDNYDNIKTVSLKAWIKRNDTKYQFLVIDDHYRYGEYRLLGIQRNIDSEYKGTYDTHQDLVDEAFHRQLKECEREEKQYFLDHDEYSILKKRFRDRNYSTTFGVNIIDWSSGRICVCNENNKERDITIDELKELLAKYEQLDLLVDKLTKETNIIY